MTKESPDETITIGPLTNTSYGSTNNNIHLSPNSKHKNYLISDFFSAINTNKKTDKSQSNNHSNRSSINNHSNKITLNNQNPRSTLLITTLIKHKIITKITQIQ